MADDGEGRLLHSLMIGTADDGFLTTAELRALGRDGALIASSASPNDVCTLCRSPVSDESLFIMPS